MKYVSELTKKAYNSEEECLNAEEEFRRMQEERQAAQERKNAERAERAKEVEEAYKTAVEANKNYRDKLNEFVKDYGSFHMTYSRTSDLINDVFDSVYKFF